MVFFVCFSQNLGISQSCPISTQIESNESADLDANATTTSECHSSEHLINAFQLHLEFAIPLFLLALVILASMLKQVPSAYFFTEPIRSYGVRRHLVFCTFQE